MKTIKIILGSITFLVLVFFSTGLFVKETNYNATITINKPVEQVFSTFTTTHKVQNWIPEIKSVETIQENIGKTGSTYKIVLDNKGQVITMTQKVMAYIPNEKVTLFFDAENMLKKDDYRFEENNGTTTITLSSSCRSDSYIMACMFPFFKSTFKRQDQSYLNNFKSFIETN